MASGRSGGHDEAGTGTAASGVGGAAPSASAVSKEEATAAVDTCLQNAPSTSSPSSSTAATAPQSEPVVAPGVIEAPPTATTSTANTTAVAATTSTETSSTSTTATTAAAAATVPPPSPPPPLSIASLADQQQQQDQARASESSSAQDSCKAESHPERKQDQPSLQAEAQGRQGQDQVQAQAQELEPKAEEPQQNLQQEGDKQLGKETNLEREDGSKQQRPSPTPQAQKYPSPPLQTNGQDHPSEDKPEPDTDTEMASHRGGHPGPVHHGYHTSSGSISSPPIYPPSTQYSSYPTVTTAGQHGDSYRMSPVANSGMSLPSMRTIDPMSQQSGIPPLPHHTMPMSMNMPLAAVSSAPSYYSGHSMALPSNYGMAHDPMARYPLPHDPRLAGHRGPKKEIKRRTKTGCLTCRKRRIKCDETHPTCNNCRKSKRECLGYDPIFRQQGGNPSSNIQPTVGSLSSTPSPAISSSQPAQSSPALAHATVSRVGHSYGGQQPQPHQQQHQHQHQHQQPMLPSVYPPTTGTISASVSSSALPPPSTSASYGPINPPSATSAPAVKAEPSYDYASSNIDPAARPLTATTAPLALGSRHLDHRSGSITDADYLRAKRMRISEIIDLLGPPAPAQQVSHTEETFNEITKVYHEMYASGLSAFFESNWYYFVENGKMTFPKDANLMEHMATFLKILEGVKANDHTQMAYSGVLETRIVWELACTVYATPDKAPNAMRISLPSNEDAAEARNRLHVVEALLCGDYLPSNPLSPPVVDPDQHRMRQFDFWYSLAEFVRKRDNPDAPATVKVREDVLSRMRHLLDGRENRDLLYSIAVVRELAPNYEPGYGSSIPQHLDESDPKNRLAVASKFILDESQVTGGTTNVVRRFSDIASRAFVNPGVNIMRRA